MTTFEPFEELYVILDTQKSVRTGRLNRIVTTLMRKVGRLNDKIKSQQGTIDNLNNNNKKQINKIARLQKKIEMLKNATDEITIQEEILMRQVQHDLLTNKYTTVEHELNFRNNAPCLFQVKKVSDDEVLATVHFQDGPINQYGVNGVNNEDLIAMVINRLEHFQQSKMSCRDNAMAIAKLEEALSWLRKRTMGREARGVVGTHAK